MLLTTLALLVGCPPTSDPDSSSDSGPDPAPEALCRVDLQCDGNVLPDPKAPCEVAIYDGDGSAMYTGAAGLEVRGRSSLAYPKPQFAMELRDYQELPVWPGAVWSYLDAGAVPGPGWTEPAFDDSAWSTGPAPMGYGQDDLATTLRPSPSDDSVTTWFRGTLTVYQLERVTRARLGLIRKDGAAVYLNGVEIFRDNLPVGADAATVASSALEHADAVEWVEVKVAPGLLRAGENTLAVEVHQADAATDALRFNLYFEALGDEHAADLGGMGGDADWILNGQYADRVLWRNRLAYDLFQSLGGMERYATESRFCELDLNGEYQGLYTLGERISRDDDRLDLPAGAAPGDSFIIKLDDEYGFRPNALGFGTWQMVYPDHDDAATASVSDFLAGWEQAVQGSNPADPNTGIFAYVDRDSAVDFVLLQELMRNIDAYDLSVHLWRAPDGKMHFTPWDFDLSMGSYPEGFCNAEGWLLRFEYIDAMVSVPEFKQALVARWAQLRQGPFSQDALLARIDGYDATLQPGLARNLERWPAEEVSVLAEGVPQDLCPVASYDDEHARVRAFIPARLAWMDENLAAY